MSRSMTLGDLPLRSGRVLPQVQLAYTTAGELAPGGRNAVLVTHGFTSSHSMIEGGHLFAEGSWASLVGPGRPIDTDRYFVVCSNMLGSAFGSTGPRSPNPATGQPWGPDFPEIGVADIVEAQHRLVTALGVRHLHAVLGPSYGGFQSLQWALDHPEMVRAIGIVTSDFHSPPGLGRARQIERLAQSPQWHGGRYYDRGGMFDTLLAMRRQTMRDYGMDRLYAERLSDPAAREQAMETLCRHWAGQFDANSLVVLAGAAEGFDTRPRLAEIRARTLLVQCTTDQIFPANAASRDALERIPAPTRWLALDSPYGHMAAGVETGRWAAELRWLLEDS